MARINPYIRFDNRCADAFKFYHECLGGDLEIQTVGDSPMAASIPAEKHSNVLHASLTQRELILFGSDMSENGADLSGGSVDLCYNSVDYDTARAVFAKLSEGGKVTHELKEEFFGLFGNLVDKFGISWMVQADKSQE